jgi:hypothetical protein
MVTWANSRLDQSGAHVVASHWDDITRHLGEPTTAWEWSESPLAPKTKHRLRKEGLIERVSGGRWRATDRLWLDVIDRADDAETVGVEAVGQELLCEPVGDDRMPRTLTTPESRPTIVEQMTLDGDTAGLDNDDEGDRWETNQAKATEGNGEGEESRDAGQLQLTFFTAGQTTLDSWTEAVGTTDPLPV